MKPERIAKPETQKKKAEDYLLDLSDNCEPLPTLTVAEAQESSEDELEQYQPFDDPLDWFTHPSVIIGDQPATAAYINTRGELVLKQRDTLGEPEATLFIRPENIDHFLERLTEIAKAPKAGLRLKVGGAK